MATTRELIREVISHISGNPNDTLFISAAEIDDMAMRTGCSRRAVAYTLNRIARQHGTPTVAIDGAKGHEVPRSAF